MQAQILTLIIPAMTAIFAGVFAALWWQDRSKGYILAYGYWFAAVAVGITLQAWVIQNFGPNEVVLFHLISSSGLIALLWGVASRDGQRAPVLGYIAVTFGTAGVIWYGRAAEVQSVVLMAQNFNAGLLFAMGAYGKWQSPYRHVSDRVLVYSLVVLAAYSIFRPSLTILAQSQMTMEQYQTSVFLTINMAITAVLCLLLSLTLVAIIVADRMEDQREKAGFDPLSGLRMRGGFEDEARVIAAKAAREGLPVSLIVADIDHFKLVNDSHGHVAGDKVIARFGSLLNAMVRRDDVTGRIGGEEFCVLIWDCALDDAAHLAERIRQAAARQGRSEGDEISPYTVSFGVAEWRSADNYNAVFERADSALYRAKDAGRNQVFTESGAFQDGGGSVVPFASRMAQRHGLGAG